MIYFTLPNFYEFQTINNFMRMLSRSKPQYFKESVSFIQTSGNFSYNYWAGSYCNMVGPGAYYKEFTMSEHGGTSLPLRLLMDNIALDPEDFYNSMNKTILEHNQNSSTVLEIASIPLMDYIQENYENYKYVFSKQADLLTPFTPELINQIIEFDKFQFIGVPDRLTTDFEFLDQISNHSKLEITVNPRCPAKCRNYEGCQIKQHLSQLEFSAMDHITLCRTNCLNKKVISLDDIKKDYIPRGINHFTFSQQNAQFISELEVLTFYVSYFIKPEYQFMVFADFERRNALRGLR